MSPLTVTFVGSGGRLQTCRHVSVPTGSFLMEPCGFDHAADGKVQHVE
jgi:hypothetical protein